MFSSKSLIVYIACIALGYHGFCEARSLEAQQDDFLQSMGEDHQQHQQPQQNLNNMIPNQYQDAANLQQPAPTANLDLEDDDDDEDRVDLQPGLNQAGSSQYQHEQPIATDQAQLVAASYPSPADLKAAASKHYHHGHGAKGWLDMGAWTGKKGAFGWYDKHPVGKGK